MSELKELFVPYQQSLDMKELGFDEPCFSYFNLNGALSDTPKESGDDIKYQGDNKFDNHQNRYLDKDESCSAPTFSQAFKWLYQKLDIEKGVMPLDIESQQLLLKQLIDKVLSKHLLV